MISFCSACAAGESLRLPSSLSTSVYSSPLELVYSDLWGPSHVTSTNGFLYYITFVDAFSRFTWIYLLKSKAETFTVFKKFKAMAELQFNTKIKNLQTDWGGEFHPLAPFIAECGINHRLVFPHTHHQNGVVERKHRHVVELGLTLLHLVLGLCFPSCCLSYKQTSHRLTEFFSTLSCAFQQIS